MKIFSNYKGSTKFSQIFRRGPINFLRSLGGPRKFLGFNRGSTKFFYKSLKFPPAPPRRYFMTGP